MSSTAERVRSSRLKKRLEVFNAYGGARCNCPACGEDEYRFLQVDHIRNNGAEHRASDKRAVDIYSWLINNKFPPGFQVLCCNCNMGKNYNYGICPHLGLIDVPPDNRFVGPKIRYKCLLKCNEFHAPKDMFYGQRGEMYHFCKFCGEGLLEYLKKKKQSISLYSHLILNFDPQANRSSGTILLPVDPCPYCIHEQHDGIECVQYVQGTMNGPEPDTLVPFEGPCGCKGRHEHHPDYKKRPTEYYKMALKKKYRPPTTAEYLKQVGSIVS